VIVDDAHAEREVIRIEGRLLLAQRYDLNVHVGLVFRTWSSLGGRVACKRPALQGTRGRYQQS
jgi:hypothetical protein